MSIFYFYNTQLMTFNDKSSESVLDYELKCSQIKKKIKEIFNSPEYLSLQTDRERAIYLNKFIISTAIYNPEIFNERLIYHPATTEEESINEMHLLLFGNRAICTGYSLMLAQLLNDAGIPAKTVSLKYKDPTEKIKHAVVKLELDGEKLYCDSTFLRLLWDANQNIDLDSLTLLNEQKFMSLFHKNKTINGEEEFQSLDEMLEIIRQSKGQTL